jgi:hypothetical protein
MRGIGRTDTGYLTRLRGDKCGRRIDPEAPAGFRSASGIRCDYLGKLPLP